MSDELEKPISQPSAADTPCAHAGQLPERLEGEHAVYELKQLNSDRGLHAAIGPMSPKDSSRRSEPHNIEHLESLECFF